MVSFQRFNHAPWPEQRARIKAMTDQILARVEAEPKTKNWEKRAQKGAGKIWYNEGFSDW